MQESQARGKKISKRRREKTNEPPGVEESRKREQIDETNEPPGVEERRKRVQIEETKCQKLG